MQNVPKTTRHIFPIIRKTLKQPNLNQFDASALALAPRWGTKRVGSPSGG